MNINGNFKYNTTLSPCLVYSSNLSFMNLRQAYDSNCRELLSPWFFNWCTKASLDAYITVGQSLEVNISHLLFNDYTEEGDIT